MICFNDDYPDGNAHFNWKFRSVRRLVRGALRKRTLCSLRLSWELLARARYELLRQ